MSGKLTGLVLFLFAFVLVGTICLERQLVPDVDAELKAAIEAGDDLSRFECPLPSSGSRRSYRIGRATNSLTIDAGNSTSGNYYYRLVSADTGHPVVDFVVESGRIETVPVPNGVFRLHEAKGTKWYGYSRLFGPDTKFTESNTNIVCSGDSHYTIKLAVINGNLESNPLKKSGF